MKTASLIVLLFSCFLLKESVATSYYYTTSNGSNFEWKSTLQSLQPGDVLTFATGTYEIPPSSKLGVTLNGEPDAPIIVQGEPGAKWFRAVDSDPQNMIDIQGTYFVLQNLELEGGSKGVRLGEGADTSNAVFRSLVIHRTMTTAFSANQPGRTYTNLTIVGNEVYDTGDTESECFYLGCQNNGCHTQDSLIDGNYCHDTLQATSGSLGSGIQVKTGSFNNRITNNVVKNTRGVCVLIYDSFDLGVNHVEGNYCENNGDNGIQATSGATIVNNIVINPTISAIRISNNQLQSGSNIRNLFIAHNTLLCSGSEDSCLRVDETGTSTNTIVNNAVFSSATSALKQSASSSGGSCGNNGLYETSASELRGATDFDVRISTEELVDPSNGNVYPLPTSKLIGAGDSSVLSKVPYDYQGNARTSNSTVGAFAYIEGSNGSAPTGIKTSIPQQSVIVVTGANPTVGGSRTNPSNGSTMFASAIYVCLLVFIAMFN